MFTRIRAKQLIKDIEEAEVYLSQFSGGYSGNYICATEFHKDFKEELEKLKNGDKKSLKMFYCWLLPTCEWDDLTDSSEESLNIANNISSQLEDIK